MKWLKNVEPTIEDMLSDPIVLKAMASYGTSPKVVRSLLESVSRSRCAMSPPASTALQLQPSPVPSRLP
jgi:hypothetical protein